MGRNSHIPCRIRRSPQSMRRRDRPPAARRVRVRCVCSRLPAHLVWPRLDNDDEHYVGRPLCGKTCGDHGGDKRLHRLRQAAVASRPAGLKGACRHARRDRHRETRRGRRNRTRPRQDSRRDRGRQIRVLACARGHSSQCREPAARADRAGGRQTTYRALAQRSGGDRFQALCARRDRGHRRWLAGASAGSCQTSAPICRRGDAGLHPSPDRPADHLRPPSARLCRDARARPGPLRRRRQAAGRVSVGRGGTGRHVVPDRPGRQPRGISASPGPRRIRSMRCRIATSRSRRLRRRRSPPCICRGSPRRS